MPDCFTKKGKKLLKTIYRMSHDILGKQISCENLPPELSTCQALYKSLEALLALQHEHVQFLPLPQ
jgi:hypothetical protein